MRRYVPLLIAGAALIAAACRDAIAPTRSGSTANLVRVDASTFSSLVNLTDEDNAATLTFDLSPHGGTQQIGEFTLVYGKNAVCDPKTSGYGEAFWSKRCKALGRPITITAHFWTDDNGRSYADFSPDIRFSPDVDVSMHTIRQDLVGGDLTLLERLRYGIWYTRRVGKTRFFVDESVHDRDLRNHFNTETGEVWRKIRHFSGFVVRTGYCADNPNDPSCAGPGGAQ